MNCGETSLTDAAADNNAQDAYCSRRTNQSVVRIVVGLIVGLSVLIGEGLGHCRSCLRILIQGPTWAEVLAEALQKCRQIIVVSSHPGIFYKGESLVSYLYAIE